MKRTKNGSTLRQKAYARGILSPGKRKTKKAIALDAGYSTSVSESVKDRIENTEGYANAMRDLAQETGNVVLYAYASIQNRDLSKEDLGTVLHAVEVLARAWDIFTPKVKEGEQPNRLRLALKQHVKNQTINVTPTLPNAENK